MSRFSRSFVVPFALLAYLLAVTVALSHHHGHEHTHPAILTSAESPQDTGDSLAGQPYAGHCHAGHLHAHCGHTYVHVATESHSHGHPHHGGFPHHHHDDCVVCQFHALKTVSTPLVTVAGIVEIVRFADTESIVRPDAPTFGLPLSRGPPSTIEA